jgi:hypothetical protein
VKALRESKIHRLRRLAREQRRLTRSSRRLTTVRISTSTFLKVEWQMSTCSESIVISKGCEHNRKPRMRSRKTKTTMTMIQTRKKIRNKRKVHKEQTRSLNSSRRKFPRSFLKNCLRSYRRLLNRINLQFAVESSFTRGRFWTRVRV